jgi:hypothetical protein
LKPVAGTLNKNITAIKKVAIILRFTCFKCFAILYDLIFWNLNRHGFKWSSGSLTIIEFIRVAFAANCKIINKTALARIKTPKFFEAFQ